MGQQASQIREHRPDAVPTLGPTKPSLGELRELLGQPVGPTPQLSESSSSGSGGDGPRLDPRPPKQPHAAGTAERKKHAPSPPGVLSLAELSKSNAKKKKAGIEIDQLKEIQGLAKSNSKVGLESAQKDHNKHRAPQRVTLDPSSGAPSDANCRGRSSGLESAPNSAYDPSTGAPFVEVDKSRILSLGLETGPRDDSKLRTQQRVTLDPSSGAPCTAKGRSSGNPRGKPLNYEDSKSKSTKSSASRSMTASSVAGFSTGTAPSSGGYEGQSEDFVDDEVSEHKRFENEELAAVLQQVLALGDPLEAAWSKFRQEVAVQASVWESQMLRRAFVEARKTKSFETISEFGVADRPVEQEALEKQKNHQEVAMQAALEAVLEVALRDMSEPIPALESLLERARAEHLLSNSTDRAGQAVIRSQRAASARPRLLACLTSGEHREWNQHDLEKLVSACNLGDPKLEYRTRQVLRMGLRGSLYRPGQSSERRNSKICQRVVLSL